MRIGRARTATRHLVCKRGVMLLGYGQGCIAPLRTPNPVTLRASRQAEVAANWAIFHVPSKVDQTHQHGHKEVV